MHVYRQKDACLYVRIIDQYYTVLSYKSGLLLSDFQQGDMGRRNEWLSAAPVGKNYASEISW